MKKTIKNYKNHQLTESLKNNADGGLLLVGRTLDDVIWARDSVGVMSRKISGSPNSISNCFFF